MLRILTLLVISVFPCAQLSLAQVPSTYRYYTIDEGLSQNLIYDITQDGIGFLWFGTKEGLNRFDGHSFVTYRPGSGSGSNLAGSYVTFADVDDDGMLWIQTLPGGLYKYNPANDSFTFVHPLSSDTTSNQLIVPVSIHGTSKSGWVLRSRNGLMHIPANFDQIRYYPHTDLTTESLRSALKDLIDHPIDLKIIPEIHPFFNDWMSQIGPNSPIVSAIQPNDSTVWIASTTGLFKGSITNPTLNKMDLGVSQSRYTDMELDGSNTLWLQNLAGIKAIDINTHELIANYPVQFASSMTVDRSGLVWVGTSGTGVVQIDSKKERFGQTTANYFNTVVPDADNAILRLLGPGSNQFARRKSFVLQHPENPSLHWVATRHAGIYLFDDATDQIITQLRGPELNPSVDNITSLFLDADTLWTASKFGITRFNLTSNTHQFYDILPHIDNGGSGFQALVNELTTSIYRDSDGIVWVGTSTSGLVRFDPQLTTFTLYNNIPNDTTSLSSNFVLSIEPDPTHPDSVLWIGTDGGGLNRLNTKTGHIKRFSVDNGLPNNVIYAILTGNDGNLWMSTNRGLVRMDPESFSIASFTKNDGLQGNEFNRFQYLRNNDGTLTFCGTQGCNRFNPSDITNNTYQARTIFSSLNVMNTPRYIAPAPSTTSAPDPVQLTWDQNVFTVGYAALDFTAPEKNQYRYQLIGFDPEWIRAGTRREVTFTNLNPGEYTLRVQSTNSDGVWSPHIAELPITIIPPWWQTTWFRIFSTLLLTSLIGLLGWGFARRNYRRNMEKLRFKMQLDEEKLRISRDMHDSIGSRLTQIQFVSRRAQSHDSSTLNTISSLASDVIRQCSEIVWSLNPENDTLEGLSDYIVSYTSEFLGAADIHARLAIDDLPELTVSSKVRHHIAMILKETLNNAVKYANSSQIEIALFTDSTHLSLKVTDFGVGFPSGLDTFLKSDSLTGQGIRTMKNRAENIGATLNILSDSNSGITILLSVPLNRLS